MSRDRFVCLKVVYFFFFQEEDGIRDVAVTGVQTCALPIQEASLGSEPYAISSASVTPSLSESKPPGSGAGIEIGRASCRERR